MFCPKCKTEYRDGFNNCSDCQIPLVDELPDTRDTDIAYVDLEEVFATNDQGDIALVKSIFERENIKYVIQGEINTPMAALPVRFMVDKKQIDRVKEILKEVL
jgi:hypothetical protein